MRDYLFGQVHAEAAHFQVNYRLNEKCKRCIFEVLIPKEFGLKVMSMKYSDFSRWNPVVAFQAEVLS
jgi:hypothetical protein